MKRCLLLPSLLCVAAPLWAQTPVPTPVKPPMPTSPLLRGAGDFSAWEIAFAYPDDKQKKDSAKAPDAQADARPRKVVMTKTNQIIHQEQTDVLNRVTDIWFNGTTEYYKVGNNPLWYELNGSFGAGAAGVVSYKPMTPTGFQDVDFVQGTNYAGTIPYGKGKCLIFTPGGYLKLDLSDAAQAQKRIEAVDTVAYIDDDARLPIAVRLRGGEIHTYRFGQPPSEMQMLPEDLLVQLRKGEDGRKMLGQPAPRPY